MSTRKSNWPAALALFVEEKRHQPFAWAANDCCTFASDWIAILTGVNPAEKLGIAGTYSTALGAAKVLADHGGTEAIADVFCAEMGWPGCGVKYARRGDLVSVNSEQGPALGVCLGAHAIFPARDGITKVPMSQFLKAWRIA